MYQNNLQDERVQNVVKRKQNKVWTIWWFNRSEFFCNLMTTSRLAQPNWNCIMSQWKWFRKQETKLLQFPTSWQTLTTLTHFTWFSRISLCNHTLTHFFPNFTQFLSLFCPYINQSLTESYFKEHKVTYHCQIIYRLCYS